MFQKDVLVAMLSTEPQGVTRLLDWLLERYPVGETIVLHTSGRVIQPAIERLDAEFASGRYANMRYKRVPILDERGEVEDILSEQDALALLGAVYRVLRHARQKKQRIHLSITNGRKTMAVYSMVAAQLLFGPHDKVWHMVSTGHWTSEIAKTMHAQPSEEVQMHMVSVPVVRWANEATVSALLEVDDPLVALQRQETITQRDRARRCQEFFKRYLTPKERKLVELLVREGLDNATLARRLKKKEQTVANQLTSVYRKFEEWRGFPSDGTASSRATLIVEFAPYFSGKE